MCTQAELSAGMHEACALLLLLLLLGRFLASTSKLYSFFVCLQEGGVFFM